MYERERPPAVQSLHVPRVRDMTCVVHSAVFTCFPTLFQ